MYVCRVPLMSVPPPREWADQLEAGGSPYEHVADFEDKQAFHMQEFQVSGTWRRRAAS